MLPGAPEVMHANRPLSLKGEVKGLNNVRPQRGVSSNIELERLEPTADGGTAGTLPSRSVFGHENFNTGRADTAYAFRTCI